MTAITYTAKDRKRGGVSALVDLGRAGFEYTLETDLKLFNPEWKDEGVNNISLGGISDSFLYRQEEFYEVETGKIGQSNQPYWREFFASVGARETFTFDAFGTVAVSDDPWQVELIGAAKPKRVANTMNLTYTFKIRRVG